MRCGGSFKRSRRRLRDTDQSDSPEYSLAGAQKRFVPSSRLLAPRISTVMLKNPARSQTCDGDLRQRNLEAAAQLFYAHEIRAAGVDLVVEKAGVVETSLCRHFGTKDDLVAALLACLLPRVSRATFYLQCDVVETAV